jgi:aminomethyltransferase
MSENLKNTVLSGEHVKLGARMVPFAGWNMPVQYKTGILTEHQHTRHFVSLFDICHMGEFRVFGPGAREALDRILARPVFDQSYGTCRYNFLLNENGGVIDDLIVYYMGEDDYFIVVNASRIDADAEQIRKNLPEGVTFVDLSPETAKLDLQGPLSGETICSATGLPAGELPKYFQWKWTEINGIRILLSRTGYTGELGFELYFPADKAVELWNYLLAMPEVKPAGLGARDTLRLEIGLSLYGHELREDITPAEAGFGAMLKLAEYPERQFIGREAMEKQGVTRTLIAIAADGRRAAREEAEVFNLDGVRIGQVSSGGFSPSLGHAIALAYVDKPLAVGTEVLMAAGSATITGKVTDAPFYKSGTARKKI